MCQRVFLSVFYLTSIVSNRIKKQPPKGGLNRSKCATKKETHIFSKNQNDRTLNNSRHYYRKVYNLMSLTCTLKKCYNNHNAKYLFDITNSGQIRTAPQHNSVIRKLGCYFFGRKNAERLSRIYRRTY